MKKIENYDKTAIGLISQSEILSKEELSSIDELKDELKDVFLNSQMFRTRTEMEVSVLNEIKHPTADSKYWQSCREQNVMFQELVLLSYEYRKNVIKIKKLEDRVEKETDKLDKELLQIEAEKQIFSGKIMERTAKDRIREIKAWHEIKQDLLGEMVCSTKDVNEHQLVSYTKRWIKQYLTTGENSSPSEMHNLVGQLKSGVKACQKKGLLNKVLKDFPDDIKQLINNELKLIK